MLLRTFSVILLLLLATTQGRPWEKEDEVVNRDELVISPIYKSEVSFARSREAMSKQLEELRRQAEELEEQTKEGRYFGNWKFEVFDRIKTWLSDTFDDSRDYSRP